ncbi:cAMP-binding domain of CRP or a regulatory subunit of cAMP-dependent protein kinases [Chitinophaga sp. YR573]|uniref:Crp/Fnr family transcriptional regulator n=1 Tax=Chitinophaga sp. YR573 TaxID=1881040 RepID=UPI0008D19C99|nr:Crp/Fnr family transcriptional regulator [Chitinophaga sp. YR573]SEW27713.1 cAMP-binding domain of CRP or a regulatory subunit of cAMP-dependent protein kinases [Chitinophaga sp. YR573]
MKKDKHDCDLQTCMLCRLCIKEWLPAVDNHRKNFSLKKGQLLFREGEPVTGIYFIFSGTVKVHKHWGEEKELIVRFARKGDIVGHRGVGAEMVYPVSATALEPVTLCFIDLEFFQASLKVNHTLLHELMMFYARELQESEKNMRNLVHMPVKGRIAHALLTLRDKFGNTEDGAIDMTLGRQDLASFTGTTYETAFRIMSELIQENVIAVSGKSIAVLNAEKLQELEKL